MPYNSTTPNYELPQYVGSDRPIRDDFNETYLKIDQAIKEVSDSLEFAQYADPENGWKETASNTVYRPHIVRVGNIVSIAAALTPGTTTTNTTIFSLPEWAVPKARRLRMAFSSSTASPGIISALASGIVVVSGGFSVTNEYYIFDFTYGID